MTSDGCNAGPFKNMTRLPVVFDLLRLSGNGLRNAQIFNRIISGKVNKPICVLILGNGFSQGFGFPSSTELWDCCLQASSKIQGKARYFEFDYANRYPLSYFQEKQIKDIELLLSIWHGCIVARKQFLDVNDVNSEEFGQKHYEVYIQNLCGHLLEYGDKAMEDKNGKISEFQQWLLKQLSSFEIRFVTLNYDLLLERIITNIGKQFFYFGEPVNDNHVVLRKPHGSANWLKTNNHPLQREDGWRPPLIWQENGEYVYNINDDYSNVPYIGFKPLPVLIPPVVNKEYSSLFQAVLKSADNDLHKATSVIIVGYSFPESDIVIRRVIEENSSRGSNFVYINSNANHCDEAKKLLGDKLSVINKAWDIEILNKVFGHHRSKYEKQCT